jgi:hypothetical protein
MQLDFNIQFTFLDMLRSTTARHPHSALELHHAETTSASQLEVHLQAALVHFPEKHNTEQSSHQVAHDNVPDNSSPTVDAEVGLIPMFAESSRNIPCPELAVLDGEHTLRLHASSAHRMLCKNKYWE